MALAKSLPTTYGVPATYWRVIQTNLDWDALGGMVAVGGYASAEARESGARPLDTRQWAIPETMRPVLEAMRAGGAGDLFAFVYGSIKGGAFLPEGADNEFAGADDV